jgi:hypothetical protein
MLPWVSEKHGARRQNGDLVCSFSHAVRTAPGGAGHLISVMTASRMSS